MSCMVAMKDIVSLTMVDMEAEEKYVSSSSFSEVVCIYRIYVLHQEHKSYRYILPLKN